jgi:hypothetical protein
MIAPDHIYFFINDADPVSIAIIANATSAFFRCTVQLNLLCMREQLNDGRYIF